MRLLHVVPSYFPTVGYGGPIQSVHGLYKALAKRGHDAWYVSQKRRVTKTMFCAQFFDRCRGVGLSQETNDLPFRKSLLHLRACLNTGRGG